MGTCWVTAPEPSPFRTLISIIPISPATASSGGYIEKLTTVDVPGLTVLPTKPLVGIDVFHPPPALEIYGAAGLLPFC